MSIFDSVANEYDAGRPTHPPGVYEVLEPLRGQVVLDVGAGTGIATTELRRREARVVAVDLGPQMLQVARQKNPGLAVVLADGARLPIGSQAVDQICFAQSWHWMKAESRVLESARVLRPGGRWSAWWSHAVADGDAWFDRFWDRVESVCQGVTRAQRTGAWESELRDSGMFRLGEVVVVPWQRTLTTREWLSDQRSKSYIEALPSEIRSELIEDLKRIIQGAFPGGVAHIPYETRLWQAHRIALSGVTARRDRYSSLPAP